MGWSNWMGRQSLRGRGMAVVVAGVAVAVLGAAINWPASAQSTGLAARKGSGISTTKHNLGSSGTGNNTIAAGTGATASPSTEICVFCHTPHAAEVARGPLWNRLAGTGTITPYTSATLTGGTVSGGMGTALTPGSVSLACLSCHDGTQAMNTLINAPGSNGYNAGGAAFGTLVSGTGLITGVAKIGGDLTNDHPIGMKYAGGRADTAQEVGGYVQFTKGTINATDAWWVDTDTIGRTGAPAADSSRQKTDMWLYARTGTTDTAYVECASCHDPHTDNALFLRIPNTYSSVCLSCHIK